MPPALAAPPKGGFALWPLVSRKRLPILHVVSDLHLESGPYELPPGLEFDILVAAGDIGPVEVAVPWLAKHDKPVVYVLGNHERWGTDFTAAVTRAKELAQGTKVHVLEREQVIIQGVRFLGATLWTNLRGMDPDSATAVGRFMRDYAHITAGEWLKAPTNVHKLRALCKKHELHLDDVLAPEKPPPEVPKLHPGIPYLEHQRTVAWLARSLASRKFRGPTVVVTHHAPSFESLRQSGVSQETLDTGRFSWNDNTLALIAGYASELLKGDVLGTRYSIDLWVHGHVHTAMDFCENAVRVVCNPRGRHEKPLTQAGVDSYRFFGYALPADAVEASERRFRADPYQGSGHGFDRARLIRLEDGFAEPLAKACALNIQRLEELHQELLPLLQVAGRGSDIRAQCVTEAFERRLDEIADVAGRLHARVTAQVCDRTSGFFGTHRLGPPRAHLRARWEQGSPPLSAKDFRSAAEAARTVVDWAQALPWVAQRGLQNWGPAALEALEYLQTRGISAKVALCKVQALHSVNAQNRIALLREHPHGAPSQAEVTNDDTLGEADSLQLSLDKLLNKGVIPRLYDIWLLDSPSTGDTFVGLAELKRRLATTGDKLPAVNLAV